MPEPVELFRAPLLDGVAHGFLGRRGGVSAGVVTGLNVGYGASDDPGAVRENRARAAAAVLPDARVVAVHQVHSPRCVTVAEPWDDDHRPEADALVTDRAGLLLGIVTADCAPVLFADRKAGVVGAAHAGWKGAFGGVIEATLEAMETLGARREQIAAAVGPCIAQPSYEVDEAFAERFLSVDSADARFFAPGRDAGHLQFDLAGYVGARLDRAGCGAVEVLGLDTYAREDSFYSYRRATHRSEPTYGRQFSLIALA